MLGSEIIAPVAADMATDTAAAGVEATVTAAAGVEAGALPETTITVTWRENSSLAGTVTNTGADTAGAEAGAEKGPINVVGAAAIVAAGAGNEARTILAGKGATPAGSERAAVATKGSENPAYLLGVVV